MNLYIGILADPLVMIMTGQNAHLMKNLEMVIFLNLFKSIIVFNDFTEIH